MFVVNTALALQYWHTYRLSCANAGAFTAAVTVCIRAVINQIMPLRYTRRSAFVLTYHTLLEADAGLTAVLTLSNVKISFGPSLASLSGPAVTVATRYLCLNLTIAT